MTAAHIPGAAIPMMRPRKRRNTGIGFGPFCFPITRKALRRVDRLRLALDLDFWPAAAFVVFATAQQADAATALGLTIPDRFHAIGARRYPPAPGGVFGQLVPVREARPDPVTLNFIRRLGSIHGLTPERAALALVAWWGECGADAWTGAPDA